VIKSPKQVAYKSLGFLKQWILMSRNDGATKDAWLGKLKEGMERWWSAPKSSNELFSIFVDQVF
jgi:hypothetical protein